jgi:hypothetical protein
MSSSRIAVATSFLLASACNKPPGAPEVVITPEAPTTGDNLEATLSSPSVDDNAKDTVHYSYRWTQDGLERGDLEEPSVPASLTSKGETWEVVVTPSDGKLPGEPASASVVIANTPPAATVEIAPALPLATEDLVASAYGEDADDDAVTFSYSWTVDGAQASYAGDTVPASATRRGELWEVTVVPNDGTDQGEPARSYVSIENTAPRITSATLGPEPAYEDSVLEVGITSEDDDDDEVSASYAFYVNGSLVQEGEQPTLTGEHFDKGQQVRAVVTPSDGYQLGNPVNSNTVTILNSPPSYASVSLDPSEIYEDSTVSCLPSGWTDADSDPEGYSLIWYVEGIAVTADETITGALFDRGDELYCEVTPHDGEEAGEPTVSDTITVSNSAPALSGASLSTTSPTESDTLSVSVTGASDPDGDSITLRYSWRVNGAVVSSAPSITGSLFDKGDIIVVEVTPSDGRSDGATVTSDTATAVNTPPELTSLTVSPGSVATDSLLTVAVATTDGDGDPVTVSYAWTVDGGSAGGDSSTLDGDSWFDKGQRVQVTATPTDGESFGSSVSSSVVTVLNSPPTTPSVGISPAEPEPGVDDLLCEVLVESTDADGDSIGYTFAWTTDGSPYGDLQVDNPLSSLIPAAQTGDNETWTCIATPSDGDDDGVAGRASVDIGEGGEEPCSYPDSTLTVSSGPASGSTIAPAYFSVGFIATMDSDGIHDWSTGGSDQPAYLEFEFYDATPTKICSVYYDLDLGTEATGWTTTSGGTLFGAWDVPLAGGYTTCPPVSATIYGSRDLRDVLESYSWGVGVGELVDLYSGLRSAVLGEGLDWGGDWLPYVHAQYLFTEFYSADAYEMGWVWSWDQDCGALIEDAGGDNIKLSAASAAPLHDAVWDGSGWLLFPASVLEP